MIEQNQISPPENRKTVWDEYISKAITTTSVATYLDKACQLKLSDPDIEKLRESICGLLSKMLEMDYTLRQQNCDLKTHVLPALEEMHKFVRKCGTSTSKQ